jgi:hypothetical protein
MKSWMMVVYSMGMSGWFVIGPTACSKNTGQGAEKKAAADKTAVAAASPQAAVKSFLKAVQAGDEKTAAKLLLNERVCEAYPQKIKKGCPRYVARVKKMLPKFMEGFAKDFEIGNIDVQTPPGAPAKAKMVTVTPKDGGRGLTFVTLEYEGKYYVGFGIKRKARMKRSATERKKLEQTGQGLQDTTLGRALRKRRSARARSAASASDLDSAAVGGGLGGARPARPARPASTRPARPARPAAVAE